MNQDFFKKLIAWSKANHSIRAVAMVGSHARGEARPDSDIDLVILVDQKDQFLNSTAWLSSFDSVSNVAQEDWGALTALRVTFSNLGEVEFGFVAPTWARVPLDAGTVDVACNGFKVVHDPNNLFGPLQAEMQNKCRG